ncbi:MAG: ribonuclease III [Ignavibacteriae bacterium]|nr:ribonuclease III [Ignavibacteriota bacterium]
MGWARGFLSKLAGKSGQKSTDQEREQTTLILKNIREFQRLIGYRIRNRELFLQALIHRSFLQRTHQPGRSNERLEFLGDSILNLIVGEYLYNRHPEADEGELTKLRSRLVNRKALAAYARDIDLSNFVIMSPSAAQSLGKGSDTIVADTFEALIAAMYLDGGYKVTKRFVERQLLEAMEKGSVITQDENYKSMLLEYAQSRGLGVPRYTIVKEEGPDHDRTFTVEVMLNNQFRGSGTGKNKKEAEQAAASKALRALL